MKEYKITVAGVEQTAQFSDEDAKARGLKSSDVVSAASEPEPQPETKQAEAPQNKGAKAADGK